MRHPVSNHEFLVFFPPYRTVEPISTAYSFPVGPHPIRGAAMIWNMARGLDAGELKTARTRPPGVALVMILPPASELGDSTIFFEMMTECRPHSVLPHQEEVDTDEVAALLRRLPSEFAIEISDYLVWRGLDVDLDTRRLVRKTLDLSEEFQSVGGLARALYMSRRALGRRFMSRGLPVPSHWLNFGRLLRAAVLLQEPQRTVTSAARALGYPDGFALSNQMKRLTGLRPSIMKECYGWEWIVEAWLRFEASSENPPGSARNRPFPWFADRRHPAVRRRGAQNAVGKGGLMVGESHFGLPREGA